jgi:hypothetical protein
MACPCLQQSNRNRKGCTVKGIVHCFKEVVCGLASALSARAGLTPQFKYVQLVSLGQALLESPDAPVFFFCVLPGPPLRREFQKRLALEPKVHRA